MPRRNFFDALRTRVPTIVVVTLCCALAADWVDAPLWLPYGIAIVVGALALVIMAKRDRTGSLSAADHPTSDEKRSWIAHELAGQGSPAGSYLLGFFTLVTVVLTGVSGAYSMPAWAALALAAAWGVANARHPADH